MTTDDHDRRGALLTAREIAALNRTRKVLKRLEDAAWRRSLEQYDPFAEVTAWDLGRLSGAATVAEDALFHVLSTARANCGVRMSDAQLRGAEVPGDGEREQREAAHEGGPDDREAPTGVQRDYRDDEAARSTGARGPARAV